MRDFLCVVLCALASLHSVTADLSPGWITYDQLGSKPYSVSYTNRSLLINGQPALFVSGSIHYPRFSQGQWDKILEQAKRDSLNLVEVCC